MTTVLTDAAMTRDRAAHGTPEFDHLYDLVTAENIDWPLVSVCDRMLTRRLDLDVGPYPGGAT